MTRAARFPTARAETQPYLGNQDINDNVGSRAVDAKVAVNDRRAVGTALLAITARRIHLGKKEGARALDGGPR